MLLRYFYAWFGMLLIAFANGTLRQLGYGPFMGELLAHQLSSFTLIIFFVLYFSTLHRRWPVSTEREAWFVGILWLILTVGFEFGFGHFVSNNPWSKLLHDYNVVEGRLWSLVLLAILVGPWLIHRWQRRHDASPAR